MEFEQYEADVLTRVDDLHAVMSDWDRLAAQSGSPLLTADWFVACAETLCIESDIRVVVVRSKGVMCAVAPLVVGRRDGVEWLEILGVSTLYEPTGFLYDSIEALHCLVSKVVSLRMPVALVRIPVDSPLVVILRELACYKGIVLGRRAASAAYVDIKGCWEDYFQSISGARRKRYRYQRKLTERLGEVTVKIERPGCRDDLQPILEEVFRIEGAGWKGRAGSALLSNARVRQFISRYSEMMCERGALCVCFLEVKGTPIATLLGVEYAQRLWVLKIGYDEQWERCSPGIQLTMETIRYTFEQGFGGYEFLGSEEPWQVIWPHHRRAFTSLVLYPMSFQGLRALTGDIRRYVVKSAYHFVANVGSRTSKYLQD